MNQGNGNFVEIKNLSKHFDLGDNKFLHAVDDVTLSIANGETLGLVGESGCGKSTLGRLLVRMYEQTSGDLYINSQKVPEKLTQAQRKKFARDVQMVFQDPFASLNPRMTVGDIVAEGPDIHDMWKASERTERIHFWLKRVGLRSEHASRFPHEFSGGQKQRIGIARALAIEPKFIVCDEPISALDVSIQAQVVNLLEDLQSEFKLTYLFIAHGLHMVRHISDRMAVMYLGQLVELGSSKDVFERPLHPYSEALIASNPFPDPEKERQRSHKLLVGEITSPVNPKPGCRFAARCPIAEERCRKETPLLREIVPGRQVACHLR